MYNVYITMDNVCGAFNTKDSSSSSSKVVIVVINFVANMGREGGVVGVVFFVAVLYMNG